MRTATALIAVPFAVGIFVGPARAVAEPIGLQKGLFFNVGGGDVEEQIRLVDHTSPYDVTPFFHADTYDTATLDVVFSGAARPHFGFYEAHVDASFTGLASPFGQLGFGAGSLDRLIRNDLDFGSVATWEIEYTIHGSMADSGRGDAQLYLRNCVGPAGSIPMLGNPDDIPGVTCDLALFDSDVESYVTSRLPFVNGVAFDHRVDFITFARFFAGTGVGTATLDYFGGTAGISRVSVFAPDGTLIPDAFFTSESGTLYTADGVRVVPEPSSLLFLGTGLAGIAARCYRNTRRR